MLDSSDYTIGWICALYAENLAAQEFLDEEHGRPEWRAPNDTNSYTLGSISKHNVVIAVLPLGEYGTASAAEVATNMIRSFPNVRIGLMVGIGGGAPSLPDRDIRLGDVVVSCPENGHSGVFQYDFGKSIQERAFQYTRSLNQPPRALLTALADLRTQHERQGNGLSEAVSEVLTKRPRLQRKYGRPSPDTDILFASDFIHTGRSCASCCQNTKKIVCRPEREPDIEDDLAVHYGTIASGHKLIKDALLRDALADEKDVLCFEMEAAGLMNLFPCLVIRGICDYSDSHKSDKWQKFAAMVAAAYAKQLICCLAPELVQTEPRLDSLLCDIQATTKQTNTVVQEIELRQDAQEKQIILDWLTSTSFGTQQSDLFARRQPNTCQWFLDTDEYRNWVQNENNNKTLFCPGIPGAGKTILSSIVIHDLDTKFNTDSTVGLTYVYCNFKSQHKQDVRMLLATILKQLCQQQPSMPDVVKALHTKHQRLESKPQIEELSATLEVVLSQFLRVYFVIDALDEWQNMVSDRSLMLRELLGLQNRSGLNLFATSRHIDDIKEYFYGFPSVEISASKSDIALYIHDRQHALPRFVGKTPGLLENIKDTLSKSSQGMFLIAQLYLEWLKTEISVRDLETTLAQLFKRSKKNDLEQVLGKLYDETMERIYAQNTHHKELAHKMLLWMSFARERLTITQVQHALALRDGDTEFNAKGINDIGLVVSVCCGLITVDEESGIIRLVHYTTQEYFRDNEARWFPGAQSYITKQCISYLSLRDFELSAAMLSHRSCGRTAYWELQERLARYPFYKYSALNWGNHARSIPADLFGNIKEIVLRFLSGGPQLDAAIDVVQGFVSEDKFFASGLHLAAHFGLDLLFDALLEKNSIKSEDSLGRTALSWACSAGHKTTAGFLIMKLLGCKGSNLNEQDTIHGFTPLHLAVAGGHFAIVKGLIEHGARTDLKDKQGVLPIFWGIMFNNKEITVALLNTQGDRAQQLSFAEEQNLFFEAARFGNVEVGQLFLEMGLDVNARDENGRTGLMEVMHMRNLVAAEWLLDQGANPNLQDKNGVTALMHDQTDGFGTVVAARLIENGADPNLQDEEGRTALMIASRRGMENRVKFLLEHGATPNLQDKEGETALLEACREFGREEGRNTIIKLLLDKGAKVDIRNRQGHSPLNEVCKSGNDEGVKIILKEIPKIDPQDKDGMVASMVLNSPIALARLLIEKGAGLNFQNGGGQTRLMVAIEEYDQITSTMIIERNANLNLQDQDGRTALDYTFKEWPFSHGGDREVIRRLLLDKGAKANMQPGAMDLSIRCPSPTSLSDWLDSDEDEDDDESELDTEDLN